MRSTKTLLVGLTAVALGGCAARMERATVQQASYEFKCAEEQITVEKEAFAQYRATGCGQTMSYQIVGECYFDWNPCHAARLADREPVPPERRKEVPR